MNKTPDEHIHQLTNHLFREQSGKMVSFLSHKYGYKEIDNILDAVQEAFEAALANWKFSGIPHHPFAWLYRVASNRLLNKIKKQQTAKTYTDRLSAATGPADTPGEQEMEDSLLKLLLFFSKIGFSPRNKLIVSLYFLCGLGYAEIAHALLMKTETVKKVIGRSKESIKQFSGKYENFSIGSIREDLPHLLQIIYLLFNEGYKTSQKSGTIQYDLCFEAIRLGKLILRYNAGNGPANGLLALMFFNTSRFPSRVVADFWVSLEHQDRELWDRTLIREGHHYLQIARENQEIPDKYYLEALISSIHCMAKSYGETDWKAISFLYRQLEKMEPNSFAVILNRIIAESNHKDIAISIYELEEMEEHLIKEHPFSYFSAKAHFYARLENGEKAIEYYKQALHETRNKTDQHFIRHKIDEIERNFA